MHAYHCAEAFEAKLGYLLNLLEAMAFMRHCLVQILHQGLQKPQPPDLAVAIWRG